MFTTALLIGGLVDTQVAQIITAYKLTTRSGGCVILKQNSCQIKQLVIIATNSVRPCESTCLPPLCSPLASLWLSALVHI